MATELTMSRYNLQASDILSENNHEFVDLTKLNLKHPGKTCLKCGNMRRADGQNKPCKGEVRLALRIS